MADSKRRAIVRVSFVLLEELLHLRGAGLRVVGVHPMPVDCWARDEALLVLEGQGCPVVHQGERYPERVLALTWQDGQPVVTLE